MQNRETDRDKNRDKDRDRKRRYSRLFFSTLKISACTFGGGFVIVPLMRKKFVEDLHWIEEDEMMDLTAIAQSSPGPIAVNAAIAVGYRAAGVGGALVSICGTILPPLVILSVISLFYKAFRDHPVVNVAMKGMLAGVAAVICDVVCTLLGGLGKKKRILPFLICAGAFLAVRIWHVNMLLVLLICGAAGGLLMKEKGGTGR